MFPEGSVDRIMNIYHEQILREIQKCARPAPTRINLQQYLGNRHLLYYVSVPECRRIAREWAKNHRDIPEREFMALLDSLFHGTSHEEKCMPAKLLSRYPLLLSTITPTMLDSWLNFLEGWAEVDSICQGTFPAEFFLKSWSMWKKTLENFSQDKNIHKRRASLVLLTSPVHQSDDRQFADMAFNNIDRLIYEKDILVTKAVSWLLRHLIRFHRRCVEQYVQDKKNILPKIAIREVMNKLNTGKK